MNVDDEKKADNLVFKEYNRLKHLLADTSKEIVRQFVPPGLSESEDKEDLSLRLRMVIKYTNMLL